MSSTIITELVQSLSQSLASSFSATVNDLQKGAWGPAGLGLSEKQQARLIKGIAKDLSASLASQVEVEEAYKGHLEGQLSKLEADKGVLREALGHKADDEAGNTNAEGGSSLPLLKRVSIARKGLEGLQSVKDRRLVELTPLIDECNALHLKRVSLTSGVAPKPLTVEAYLKDKGAASELSFKIDGIKNEIETLEAAEEELKTQNEKLLEDLEVPQSEIKEGTPSKDVNKQLNGIKHQRVAELKALGETISKLWTDLAVPREEQTSFSERVKATGLKPVTLAAGRDEVKRLRKIKAENQSKDLVDSRETITKLWGMLGYSDEQCKKFAPFRVDPSADEDLLQKHSAYQSFLQKEFDSKRSVLALLQKYEELAKSRQEIFDMENADNKLGERRNSASHSLEVSKKTAAVSRDMPKVLAKLVQAVKAMEATPVMTADGRQVRRPFLWKGVRYLQTLDAKEKAFRAQKEQQRADREKRKLEKRIGKTPGAATMKASAAFLAKAKAAKSRVALSKSKTSPTAKSPLAVKSSPTAKSTAKTPPAKQEPTKIVKTATTPTTVTRKPSLAPKTPPPAGARKPSLSPNRAKPPPRHLSQGAAVRKPSVTPRGPPPRGPPNEIRRVSTRPQDASSAPPPAI